MQVGDHDALDGRQAIGQHGLHQAIGILHGVVMHLDAIGHAGIAAVMALAMGVRTVAVEGLGHAVHHLRLAVIEKLHLSLFRQGGKLGLLGDSIAALRESDIGQGQRLAFIRARGRETGQDGEVGGFGLDAAGGGDVAVHGCQTASTGHGQGGEGIGLLLRGTELLAVEVGQNQVMVYNKLDIQLVL